MDKVLDEFTIGSDAQLIKNTPLLASIEDAVERGMYFRSAMFPDNWNRLEDLKLGFFQKISFLLNWCKNTYCNLEDKDEKGDTILISDEFKLRILRGLKDFNLW